MDGRGSGRQAPRPWVGRWALLQCPVGGFSAGAFWCAWEPCLRARKNSWPSSMQSGRASFPGLDLLRDLKARGWTEPAAGAAGDGGLGFWAALAEEYPTTRAQRCRVHKTASVLDKFPKTPPPPAKDKIHPSYLAPTQAAALKSFDALISLDDAQYPKACECLRKEAGVLFIFHDFPAAHWQPLRTTNPIESTFATVRRRTEPTKGRGSRKATLTMVWPLARAAAKDKIHPR